MRWLLVYEGVSMAFHSFGGLRQNLRVSRIGLGGQWAGLRGIPEKVKNQRRVVVGHVLSEALADTSVVASTSARWGKVRSEKVHLKDRVTWTETHRPESEFSEKNRRITI